MEGAALDALCMRGRFATHEGNLLCAQVVMQICDALRPLYLPALLVCRASWTRRAVRFPPRNSLNNQECDMNAVKNLGSKRVTSRFAPAWASGLLVV